MLDAPCTQEAFSRLVGISQPAVSDLLTRGILKPGQPAAEWLIRYTAHLREQAAGRGADGELAANRAATERTRKELLDIRLAERRKEVAPVDVIEQVLAHIGRQIRGTLEPLHVKLKMRCPQLGPEDLKLIEADVATACNLAASMSVACLADLESEDPAGDDTKVALL